MSDDIVAAYQAGNPTRANSREIVKQIANDRNLTEAKVRSVLSRAGVYISLPKDKSKIEASDYDSVIKRFSDYDGDEGESHFGPDVLMTSVAQEFGYGKWALSEFYRDWKVLGRPINSRQFNLMQSRRAEDRQQAFNEEVDRISAPRIAAIEKKYEVQRMLIKASQPHSGSGIFNPMVATLILFVLVVAGLAAVIGS